MAKPYLSVIVPVYNDAERIAQSLIAIDYALSLSAYSSEVIVVDDGSTDTTGAIAHCFKKVLSSLRVVSLAHHRGIGAAITEGIGVAHGNVRLILPLARVEWLHAREEILAALHAAGDIVVGSRNIGVQQKSFAHVVRRALRVAGNRIVCGKAVRGVTDIQCSALCMTEEMAGKLFSSSDALPVSGLIFFDVCRRAVSYHARIKEIACSESSTRVQGMPSWLRLFMHARYVH